MDAERYQKIKRILHAATQRRGAARKTFLDGACGDDESLRAEVESLLKGTDVPTEDLLAPIAEAIDGPPPPRECDHYRIGREVGRGGMGAVYEATDTRDGGRVALKVIHSNLSTGHNFTERFAREAAMGQRVDHPNVVRTLGTGRVESGGHTFHYLVMEFVEGKGLRELLEELGTVPEALLREIAEQVSDGLAAIHAAGIVHRDLKPDNILITGDQRVRIMDLGIAKLQDASIQLTMEGQFIGSLAYAAPEQCDGREIGEPADLYSLGVLLYEFATGLNPFRHENPGAVIRAQLDLRPRPAADLNPDISLFFSEVLATLLAKDPADRFATSRELNVVLAEGEIGLWWIAREHELTARQLPNVAVRRETGMYGRTAELDRLHAVWQEARHGRGRAVLIEGEAGLGKSRLVDAFLKSLAGDDAHILYGSYPPVGGMRGLSDAIFSKFGIHDLGHALGPYLPPALASALAAFGQSEPQPHDADLLQAACVRLLEALAADGPTLWVMEDIHFAPEAGRAVALALSRAAETTRALVLLTSRPRGPRDRWEKERLPLSRLSRDDVVALLREAHPHLDERLCVRIAAKSDGVPLYVLEMLPALGRDSGDITIPSAVRDVIGARLSDLSREERAILDVGAVQGYEFDADLAATVLGMPLVTLLQLLADVERRVGVVRAAGRVYRFDHHLVQEVVYADLPDRLREEYHTRLADAHKDDTSVEDAWFLASHHLRGRRPEAARPFLTAALEHLEGHYQHEAALELMDRARDLLERREQADLLLRKVSRFEILGQREEQLAAAREALDIARELKDTRLEARARLALGSLEVHVSKDELALDNLTRAKELALEAGDTSLQQAAMVKIGIALARVRRDEEAIEELQRAREMPTAPGEEHILAQINGGLGAAYRHLNRYEDARRMHEEAIEIARACGSRGVEAYQEGNLGLALYHLGRFEEAVGHIERQRVIGIEIGDRRSESASSGNLGVMLFDLGRLDEAFQLCRRHHALAIAIDDKRAAAVALSNIGVLYRMFGEADAAQEHLDAAMELSRTVNARHLVGGIAIDLGRVARDRGDVDEAARHYREAAQVFDEIRDKRYRAEALLALGRLLDAPEHVREAQRLAEEADLPEARLRAATLLGDAETAKAALKDGARVGCRQRMESLFLLWQLTKKREHLDEANRILQWMSDHAPETYRKALIEQVPTHREIRAAHDAAR